jgi:hypothetical protein
LETELLGEGSEVFLGLDVFGQFCGHGFEFFLIHFCTHDGILLKRLLSRGQLHNLVYRLMGRFMMNSPSFGWDTMLLEVGATFFERFRHKGLVVTRITLNFIGL